MRTTLLFFLFPLGLLTACPAEDKDAGTDDADADTDADSDADADADTDADVATITLTNGIDGANVYESTTVTWEVAGLTMNADAIGGADVDGEGHAHVYLDPGVGEPGADYQGATADLSWPFTGLTAGSHVIEVRLATNSHQETFAATSSATVNVLAPAVTIVDPASPATLDAGSVFLNLAVSDFTIVQGFTDPTVYTIGEGHYHVYVDDAYTTAGFDLANVLVPRLDVGDHTIEIRLSHSDHSEQGAAASIDVTVPGGVPSVEIDATVFTPDYASASVPLTLDVQHLTLDADAIGGANEDGHGHYHVYLDGVYTDASAEETYWLEHVPAGEHTVMVRLAHNDHTETNAADYTTFDVADDAKDVTISSPLDGEVIAGDFYLTVGATNFTLDTASIETANVDGVGHYHVYLDGDYLTASGEGLLLLPGLPAGEHEVSVRLAQNDHTEVEPRVTDAVTIVVE